MIRSVVCYSVSLAHREPMAYLRLIGPCRNLGVKLVDGLKNSQVVSDVSEIVSQGDVVIIQREFPGKFDLYREVIRSARVVGKPVIMELDDLFFFMPEQHPDRQAYCFAPALLPMLQALLEADAVIVSTQKMREMLVAYNENVFVIPNYLDDMLWSFRSPVVRNSSCLVIGYMGTKTHRPDLEYITPVLLNIIKKYPHRVRLRFWGVQPPPALHSLPEVECISDFYYSYEEFVAFFQTQSADIFIAPLVDNLFNRCKSPLKFLEYSVLGAPGVYSRLEPYEGVVQHGQNGFLAYSLEEWEWCLTQLIEDDGLRMQMAEQAQKTIMENWLLSQNAFRWKEVWETILASRKKAARYPFLLDVLESINIQLFEAFQAHISQLSEQAQVIQNLTGELENRDQIIQSLNQEILGYVLSRSWQMTRPFRMIDRFLKNMRAAYDKGSC